MQRKGLVSDTNRVAKIQRKLHGEGPQETYGGCPVNIKWMNELSQPIAVYL